MFAPRPQPQNGQCWPAALLHSQVKSEERQCDRLASRKRTPILVLLLLALVGTTLTAAQAPSFAQSRLGATDGNGPLPAPASATNSSGVQSTKPAELTASRLLEMARRDIAQGQPEIAQRLLENLIARFPQTPSAEPARRELFTLYGASFEAADPANTAGRQPGSAASTSQRATAEPFATAPPSPQPSATAASPWRTQTILNPARLQDELRNGTGDRVFFGPGSFDLGSRARAVLNAQAAWMLARPEVSVVIEGHADDAAVGGDNERIAAARATAVRDRLIAEGIAPSRLQILARGASDPIATCPDSTCAAQNRRVVMQVGVLRPQSAAEVDAARPRGPAPGDHRR